MPDWLLNDVPHDTRMSLGALAVRLLLAAAGGVFVSGTYVIAQRRITSNVISFAITLMLMTVLVAMAALVIGQNVALAFLVGALSIIRFRSVVDDTRDTAFVIYCVVVGMAIGSGQIGICFVGIPIVSVIAISLSRLVVCPAADNDEQRLEIRLASGHDPTEILTPILSRELEFHRLTLLVTARQGASLDLRYAVRFRANSNPLDLIKELQKIDGVQGVEWREA